MFRVKDLRIQKSCIIPRPTYLIPWELWYYSLLLVSTVAAATDMAQVIYARICYTEKHGRHNRKGWLKICAVV